jgi:hypothetical protein
MNANQTPATPPAVGLFIGGIFHTKTEAPDPIKREAEYFAALKQSAAQELDAQSVNVAIL